jgi:hypothetical protein
MSAAGMAKAGRARRRAIARARLGGVLTRKAVNEGASGVPGTARIKGTG